MEKYAIFTPEQLYHIKNCVQFAMTFSPNEELKPIYEQLCRICEDVKDDVPISFIYPELVKQILADIVGL